MRLAVLGSATVSHLLPAIRIAGLRRGIWIDIYEGHYGAYRQDILDPKSGLHAFRPDEILLILDANHATGGLDVFRRRGARTPDARRIPLRPRRIVACCAGTVRLRDHPTDTPANTGAARRAGRAMAARLASHGRRAT